MTLIIERRIEPVKIFRRETPSGAVARPAVGWGTIRIERFDFVRIDALAKDFAPAARQLPVLRICQQFVRPACFDGVTRSDSNRLRINANLKRRKKNKDDEDYDRNRLSNLIDVLKRHRFFPLTRCARRRCGLAVFLRGLGLTETT